MHWYEWASLATGLISGLLDNPHRVGKPLAREFSGYHSARRVTG